MIHQTKKIVALWVMYVYLGIFVLHINTTKNEWRRKEEQNFAVSIHTNIHSG